MRLASFFFVAGLVAGCGDPPAPTSDAGVGDAAIEICLEPDRVCPASEPFPGSPCEGMLHCEYGAGFGNCVAGEWTWESLCDGGGPGGGGCAPPLVESCEVPFTGALPGATLLVGPDDPGPFRPFAANEHVEAVHGPQGGSMLAYRLRVTGAGGAPTCVSTATSVVFDGMTPTASDGTVELHCGQTLRIYEILPARPCESREYPTTLSVEVEGVGTATVPLVIDGSPCPR